ncbi:hypothetical protein JCM8208_005596 [Rhodotorula glutinis]
MTTEDFQVAARKALDDMEGGPESWTFHGLKRTESGALRDEDIVKLVLEATDNVASAFKARAIPEVMRAIDLLGMEQARKTWRCCTMNEFREFLGLKKYSSFDERDPDKDVARAAEKLYKHVDHPELYPSLMAEEPKPSTNASGLPLGYSISRAILSDAAVLVRGNRFFTSDYNAGNLTSCMREGLKPELDKGFFGGVIGKLLVRHFAAYLTYNSIYALFPLSTPHKTKVNLERLGIASDYLRLGDSPKGRDSAAGTLELALFPPHWAQTALVDLGDVTKRMLDEQAFENGQDKLRVDVVGDVAVPIIVEYLADLFEILIKAKSNALGEFTVDGLCDAPADTNTFVYLDFDPTVAFKLRDRSRKHSELLRGIILMRLGQTESFPVANFVDFFLDVSRKKDLQNVCGAAQQQVGMANDSLIVKYVPEAMGLRPSGTGIARRVKGDADKKPNELIWVDLVSCGRDDDVRRGGQGGRDARCPAPQAPLLRLVGRQPRGLVVQRPALVSGIVRELLTVNSPSRPSGSEGQLGVVEGPLGLRVYARNESREHPRIFSGRMIVAFEGVEAKR